MQEILDGAHQVFFVFRGTLAEGFFFKKAEREAVLADKAMLQQMVERGPCGRAERGWLWRGLARAEHFYDAISDNGAQAKENDITKDTVKINADKQEQKGVQH